MIPLLLCFLLAVLLGVFALANPAVVPVALWPRGLLLDVAMWQAILLPAALAFLAGAAIVWFAHVPQRRRLREVEQAARLLEADLAARDAPKP